MKSLATDKVNCCILLRIDNVSTVWYINHLEGMTSVNLAELKDFWHYYLDALLSASRIPPRSVQCGCGLELQTSDRFQRLETPYTNLIPSSQSMGSSSQRSLPLESTVNFHSFTVGDQTWKPWRSMLFSKTGPK